MLADLPILAICGWSGSGKTTLIEPLVRRLAGRGLKVAVVKHDVHGLDVDRPGKDSDRLFRAGADVLLQGEEEVFFRTRPSDCRTLTSALSSLVQQHDLVLVEGHKKTALPKIWLLRDDESEPPDDVDSVLATLPWDTDRLGAAIALLDRWLPAQWLKTPVFGCVLIGGKSRRMGRPKHLIVEGGKTWLERTVALLEQVCQRLVIAGAGEVPASLARHVRLPDVPDAEGPLSGILAAMRWAPHASWLVVACDLSDLSLEALQWLLSTRAPGVWATVPKLTGSARVEPLLAHYDFRARALLEEIAAEGDFRVHRVVARSRAITPSPPPELTLAWRNVNTETMLKSHPL